MKVARSGKSTVALQYPTLRLTDRRTTKVFLGLFLFFWTLIAPVYALVGESKYLSFVYILAMVVYLATFRRVPNPARAPIFLLFLAWIALLMLVHAGDYESVRNLGSTLVGSVAVGLLAWISAKNIESRDLDVFLIRILSVLIVMSYGLSISLTIMHFPGAITVMPWDAIADGERLLVITPTAGQTINTYLEMFALALYVGATPRSKLMKITRVAAFGTLIALLLASRSREGMFAIVAVFIFLIAQKVTRKTRLMKLSSIVLISILAFYVIINFSPAASSAATTIAAAAQSHVPWIRIYSPDYGLTTGRASLNSGLLPYALSAPVFGLGHSAPVLQWAVDSSGVLSASGTGASSESGLRMAVAYGWPYLGIVALLILSPMISARKVVDRNELCVQLCIVWTVMMLMLTAGALSNLYGDGSLSLFFVLTYYFKNVQRRYRARQAGEAPRLAVDFPGDTRAGGRLA